MKFRRWGPAFALLAVAMTGSCAAQGNLAGHDYGQQGADSGADQEEPTSSDEEGVQDPHASMGAKEFNIFFWGDFAELRREYVWMWNSDDTTVPGVAVQTAATQFTLVDEANTANYICNALTLDFNTPYIAYSDFNLNDEIEFTLTGPQVYNTAIFRAYIAPDGDSTHRSATISWDVSRVALDEKHPELGYSIFINEKENGANPGVYYTLDDFFASIA